MQITPHEMNSCLVSSHLLKFSAFFLNIIINMLCPLLDIQTPWKIEVQQCSQCKTNKNLFASLACLTGLSCHSSLDSNLYNSRKLSWIQNCLGHIYLSLILQSAGFFLTSIHKILNHNNNNKKEISFMKKTNVTISPYILATCQLHQRCSHITLKPNTDQFKV